MRFLPIVVFLAQTFGADWPQFGGPRRDFSLTPGELPTGWPEQGPKVLWKLPLGDGYSGIAVSGGVLYTMYETRDSDAVIALDAKSGKTLWEHELSRKTGKSLDPCPIIATVAVGCGEIDAAGGKRLPQTRQAFGKAQRIARSAACRTAGR